MGGSRRISTRCYVIHQPHKCAALQGIQWRFSLPVVLPSEIKATACTNGRQSFAMVYYWKRMFDGMSGHHARSDNSRPSKHKDAPPNPPSSSRYDSFAPGAYRLAELVFSNDSPQTRALLGCELPAACSELSQYYELPVFLHVAVLCA